nr:hypothetical protein [Tanacetum cinerariifolium]
KKKGDSASSTTPPTPTLTTIVVSAPRLSATGKGKQPSRATTPVEPTDVQRTEAEQLKIVLKRADVLCCLPLAVADSLGADTTVVVGVRVGGVVEEAESPFFFLALAFGLGAASPDAQA